MRMAEKISFLTRSLMLLLAVLCWNSIAAAQQPQEKRIALVVGNAAYAKAPLATAANDAGLIAQTLQAAGFDVIGARDLDGDTLRKSFRDFMQKAQASGARYGRLRLSRRLWRCSSPARTISCRSIPHQPRHRCADRGAADLRLHPPACLAAAEGQHRRAGRGAATALRRKRRAARRRSRAGRGRRRTC